MSALQQPSQSPMPSASAYAKATATILTLTILLKALGALQQAMIAFFFGAGSEMDSYFTAVSVPNLLVNMLMLGPLSLVLIPVFSQRHQKGEGNEAWSVASVALSYTAIGAVALAASGALIAPLLVSWLAPGFGPEDRILTANLMKLLMPAVGLASLSALLKGILYSHERFATPNLAFVASSVTLLLATILFASPVGVYGIAVGTVNGAAVALCVQLRAVVGLGGRLMLSVAGLRPLIRELGGALVLMGTVTAGTQLYMMTDRWVASFLGPGSISLLDYALNFDKLVGGTIGVAAASASFPSLAALASSDRSREFRATVGWSLRSVAVTAIPAVAGIVALREPLIRFWLERGKFTAEDSLMVSAILLALCPAILSWAFQYPVTYALFALGRAGRAALVTFAGVAVNLALALTLSPVWGLKGVSVATSLTSVLSLSAMFWMLTLEIRHQGTLGLRPILEKVMMASLAAGVAAWGAGRWGTGLADIVSLGPILPLALGASVGSGVFIAVARTLRIEEIDWAWAKMKGELRSLLGRRSPGT